MRKPLPLPRPQSAISNPDDVLDPRCYVTEGRDWLERVLSLTDGDAANRSAELTVVRSRAYRAAWVLACWQGDGNSSPALAEEALRLAQEAGDQVETGWALMCVGMEAFLHGQLDVAWQRHEQGLAIFRDLGDAGIVAVFLEHLGWIAREQGDYKRARSLTEESLRISRELGNRNACKRSLSLLGILHMVHGDYAEALACYEESLAISQEVGIPECVGIALYLKGALARYQGDLETAREQYEQSIRTHHQIENWAQLRLCLVGLGCVTVMMGEKITTDGPRAKECFARGARLWGASERLGEATRWMIWSFDRPDYERCVAVAHAELGETAFAAAWAEGRRMSTEEAVADALEGEEST